MKKWLARNFDEYIYKKSLKLFKRLHSRESFPQMEIKQTRNERLNNFPHKIDRIWIKISKHSLHKKDVKMR